MIFDISLTNTIEHHENKGRKQLNSIARRIYTLPHFNHYSFHSKTGKTKS